MIVTRQTAILIEEVLGLRSAAMYLRINGIPLAVALYWLAGSTREVHASC